MDKELNKKLDAEVGDIVEQAHELIDSQIAHAVLDIEDDDLQEEAMEYLIDKVYQEL